jgi:uncharacterized membrane protein YkoI
MNTGRKTLASLALLAALAAPVGAQQKAATAQQKPMTTAQQKAMPAAQQKPATTTAAAKVATKTTSHSTSARYPAVQQERPGLLARATVKPLAATRTALKEEPGARVVSRKLVERGQSLVYVIALKPSNGPEKEINVDAKTGKVVPMTPSTPKGR